MSKSAASELERIFASELQRIFESELERIFDRVSARLNDHLCEMKPGYDDSIIGFNEAWDVMRAVFKDELAKTST